MSDQLFKKRKIRNLEKLKREQAKIEPYDKILIVSEGEKTEPNYFNDIIKVYKLSTANVRVDGSCGSSPITVVQYAIDLAIKEEQKKFPFDKVYCVIDKDAHPCYKSAIELATTHELKDKITVISSVPSFEFWLLLHYKYTTKAYSSQKNNSCGRQVLHDLKQVLPDYEKGMENVFTMLKEKLPDALQNAKLVNSEAKKNNTDMPSTKVHELVEKLINLKI